MSTAEIINEATTPISKESPTILTRGQVCDMLSISLATLWKYTKDGKLQSYGIGRRVFYKRKEVIEALIPLK